MDITVIQLQLDFCKTTVQRPRNFLMQLAFDARKSNGCPEVSWCRTAILLQL